MRRKILSSMMLLTLVTILLSTLLMTLVMYKQLSENMHREMNNQAVYIEAGLVSQGIDYLNTIKGADKSSRITLIDVDGTVLFDNRVPLSDLDNHKTRPEVAEAIKTGRGESVRMSDSVGSQTYYLAFKLPDGTILRISSTTNSIYRVLVNRIPIMLLIIAAVLCLAILIARYQTKSIITPINNLDLENPTENEIYGEISPLLIRIKHQRSDIEMKINELQQGKDQFDKITENMVEGLLILDEEGYILSANQSVLWFLGTKELNPIGKHFSNLNRSTFLKKYVDIVLGGNFIDEQFTRNSNHYQFRATPVVDDTKNKGAIILILDVTQKQKSEIIRREFTANVSHELKTPLTVISGFAELLSNGMVKSEDVPTFSAKIYEEVTRLIALVEDIIRLSQLDEKTVPLPLVQLDLLEIAKKVVERLMPLAERKNVLVTVQGEVTFIIGVPQLVDELIYNLCENAIKYNKENGTISIDIANTKEKVILTVEDTGIGISAENKERIFERFYRVDKSHSKTTGGTGLGLSIVKHIVNYHNAEIEIESAIGIGTKIIVSFPK